MWKKYFLSYILLFIKVKLAFGIEVDEKYVVKSGDTLSEVLYEKTTNRLYGNDGLLIKVLEKNKNTLQDLDKIYPGQILILPLLESSNQDTMNPEENLTISNPDQKNELLFHPEWGLSLINQARALQSLDLSSSSRSELVSDVGFGLKLHSQQLWNEFWNTKIFMKILFLKFKNPQGRNLVDSNLFLTDWGFELKKIFHHSSTNVSLLLHLPQKLYLKNSAPLSSNLDVDQTYMIQGEIKLKQRAAKSSRYQAGITTGAGYFYHTLSSSSTLQSGLHTQLGLYIENQLQALKLFSELNYHYEKSKSTTLQYVDKYFEWMIGAEF